MRSLHDWNLTKLKLKNTSIGSQNFLKIWWSFASSFQILRRRDAWNLPVSRQLPANSQPTTTRSGNCYNKITVRTTSSGPSPSKKHPLSLSLSLSLSESLPPMETPGKPMMERLATKRFCGGSVDFQRGSVTKVSNAGSIVFDGTIDNREYKAHTGAIFGLVYRYVAHVRYVRYVFIVRGHACNRIRVSPLRGVCLSTCFGTRTIFAIGNRTMARHTATRAWPTCRSYVPMRNTQQFEAAIRVSIPATQSSPSSSSSSSSSLLLANTGWPLKNWEIRKSNTCNTRSLRVHFVSRRLVVIRGTLLSTRNTESNVCKWN